MCKVPQISPVFPSGKNNMWIKTNMVHWWTDIDMVHWWTDIDKRKPKYSEKNLYQCYAVHYVSHTDCPGTEPAPM